MSALAIDPFDFYRPLALLRPRRSREVPVWNRLFATRPSIEPMTDATPAFRPSPEIALVVQLLLNFVNFAVLFSVELLLKLFLVDRAGLFGVQFPASDFLRAVVQWEFNISFALFLILLLLSVLRGVFQTLRDI